MRLGLQLQYSGGFREAAAEIGDYERAGLDIAFVPEAYSFDAISQLGYLAARTQRLTLASGIVPFYSRTPSLLAMTAAGLDFVSDGRFELGIGASGPQVIEGFHGVPYDAPLARTREVVEICRQVWRREKVVADGPHYPIPLPPGQGTGLGKPLKLINTPVRERIPIILAAVGPKNVELAAEIAEGWIPAMFHPERASSAWGASLAAGSARRDPALPPLDVVVGVSALITDGDRAPWVDQVRPQIGFYLGGMGARSRNFYNDLARRYGYEREAALVQDLYLAGKHAEAIAAVPDDLVEATCLIGSAGEVRERIARFAAAGVTTLNVSPLAPDPAERLRTVEQLRALVD